MTSWPTQSRESTRHVYINFSVQFFPVDGEAQSNTNSLQLQRLRAPLMKPFCRSHDAFFVMRVFRSMKSANSLEQSIFDIDYNKKNLWLLDSIA